MRWAWALLSVLALTCAEPGRGSEARQGRVEGLVLPTQENPEELYKAKLGTLSKSCAGKHYSIGEFLTTSQMHLWAREQYNKTIQFDPDHEGARKKLGFKKGDSGWENDPDAKIEGNKKKETDAEGQRIKKAYLDRIESAGKDISHQWADLALWCRKNNMSKEATEAFRKAVEYDPTNAVARKELGYEKDPKDPKGAWISKQERELRKEMKDGIPKAPSGAASTQTTEVEKGLEQKHTKRESSHFLIESPHLKDADMGNLLQHAEHAYAMYHKIVGESGDLFGGRKMDFVVLKDKPQHLRYIDTFHRGSAAQKELARKSTGSGGFPRTEAFQDTMPLNVFEDWVIHETSQMLSHFFVEGEHLWIHEGTAYQFTRLMKDSAAWT